MTRRLKDQGAVAVLVSGGVESAALLAQAIRQYARVYPVYVRKGFNWEAGELLYLKRLLSSLEADGLARLTILEVPAKAIYGHHWSIGPHGTPRAKDPDAAVYLPGRNLLLLSLAGLFCAIHRIPTLWIGILKGNPFHDARSGFLREVENLLHTSLDFSLRIAAPFRELTKGQVIQRNDQLPWERTFSCLKPIGNRHCGRCQKCAERKGGFKEAGVSDPTGYAR